MILPNKPSRRCTWTNQLDYSYFYDLLQVSPSFLDSSKTFSFVVSSVRLALSNPPVIPCLRIFFLFFSRLIYVQRYAPNISFQPVFSRFCVHTHRYKNDKIVKKSIFFQLKIKNILRIQILYVFLIKFVLYLNELCETLITVFYQ